MILLDELCSLGLGDTVGRLTILEVEIDLLPQQATIGIDVINDHPGHVRISDAHEREWTGLLSDDPDLDG